MKSLKNLRCKGVSRLGDAIRDAFDLVNRYRMRASSIENLAAGRTPGSAEPSLVMVFTDGVESVNSVGAIGNEVCIFCLKFYEIMKLTMRSRWI